MAPLDTLSVSQVELADHGQRGGCLRRWWFERVQGFRPEQTGAQTHGQLGHELLAEYLKTGAMPRPRVKMGKMVTAAINKGGLPAPGSGLIETRFDGQEMRDSVGRWIPVNREKTFWLGGIPWDGFIDYQSRESQDGILTVLDHKFTSDLQYAKPNEGLIKTVQMPVYCLVTARRFPGQVRAFRIVHHYVCRRGTDSLIRRALVTPDQVLERRESILRVVERMKSVVQVDQQSEVPFNLKSCSAYTGCPHQARCRAFAGKDRIVSTKYAELTEEEKALFPSMDEGALYAVSSDPKKVESTPAKAELAPAKLMIADVDENENPIVAGKDFGPPPAAPEPAPVEKASCPACGVVLTDENSSRLRNGPLVHVGCPAGQTAAAASKVPGPEPVAALAPAAEPMKRKPGRPPGSKNKPAPVEDPPQAPAATGEVRALAPKIPDPELVEASMAPPETWARDNPEGAKVESVPGIATASLVPANISITVDVGPLLGALIRKLAGN